MRTAAKVAAAFGAVALGVGAPVGFVVRGAGAPGRPDSAERWWERVRRLPEPVLGPRERASSVTAGGAPVRRVAVEAKPLEAREVPSKSPVVAIAEREELVAVATFDDGAFVVEPDGATHRVEGVDAVNALAFDEAGALWIASDDGAYVAQPGERARRVAKGAFSAVARVGGDVWFAGRGGVAKVEGEGLTRWGAEQGVNVEQPTALAACGDGEVCVGAVDGARRLKLSAKSLKVPPDAGPVAAHNATADSAREAASASTAIAWRMTLAAEPTPLPTQFVTAIASSNRATWFGTFDGGLAQLGGTPLTPADGLPEGRINPRALAVQSDTAFAGTPSGLLVARGRSAALLPVGGEVTSVASSHQGGVWLGLSGRVVRMSITFASDELASARNP